jgi:hypothetical protein
MCVFVTLHASFKAQLAKGHAKTVPNPSLDFHGPFLVSSSLGNDGGNPTLSRDPRGQW